MYDKYQNTILECLQTPSIGIQNFKRNTEYREILEHLSPQLGLEYLVHIWNDFRTTTEDIVEYCNVNDKIGNPYKYSYCVELECSPSSIRYIYHALLILKHIQSLHLETTNIVEVGCGYGGLCLAIDFFSKKMGIKINKYVLIDLDEPSKLQQTYLANHTLSFPCEFYTAKNFGKEINETNLFLISNYCFSEIDETYQKMYKEILFPKCTHGFLVWNAIPYYDIGKEVRIEEERPQTDVIRKINKFVYF